MPQDKFDLRVIHAAFERGDLKAVQRALHDLSGFPNSPFPPCNDWPLIYAIYHSPIKFIQQLLELGADPKVEVNDGFPSLVAALMTERSDRVDVVKLLLEFGADVQQRGINGWFPLHCAAHNNDVKSITLLLEHGADPNARTNVDDYETALEESERFGKEKAAGVLRKQEQKK